MALVAGNKPQTPDLSAALNLCRQSYRYGSLKRRLMLMESHTILLVDDEPTNLKLMERLVKGSFRTIMASSGEEALQILQREGVAMLISDQRMPGMSGTELLRKARILDPDIICLLVTAAKDIPTFVDAMINCGAIGVIHKPWDPDVFMETIRDAIKKYETRLTNKQALDKLKGAIDALDKIANSKESLL
jgi:DNA-binding NtrC family response regulator